jgi:hypothetical protein
MHTSASQHTLAQSTIARHTPASSSAFCVSICTFVLVSKYFCTSNTRLRLLVAGGCRSSSRYSIKANTTLSFHALPRQERDPPAPLLCLLDSGCDASVVCALLSVRVRAWGSVCCCCCCCWSVRARFPCVLFLQATWPHVSAYLSMYATHALKEAVRPLGRLCTA